MKYEDILQANPFFLDQEACDWVFKTLASLTIKEKIGQCFDLNCTKSDSMFLQQLLAFSPGALHRAKQISQAEFIEVSRYVSGKSKIPLLMSADLEHGMIHPFNEALNFHSPLGVAATGNVNYAAKMGKVTAQIGKAYGINWSFTPDVDIIMNFRNNATGTRTFGSNPETVLDMARAYIENMQSHQMACTVKHWPGDGVDERDQHLVTTSNSLSMDKWRETYGKVYQELIRQGIKSVMSCHIRLPAYDREIDPNIPLENILPASLSANLNKKLLRKELGFNGLIISDSTYMGGLGSQGPRSKILPKMLENGCDMLLFAGNPYTDISYIVSAWQQGRLSQQRIDEAVVRILALKASLNLHKKTVEEINVSETPLTDTEKTAIDNEIRECVKNSITLVKDTQKILPLDPAKQTRVLLFQTPHVPEFAKIEGDFASILESKGFQVTKASANTEVDEDLYDVIIYALNQFEYFGVGSRRIDWAALHFGIPKGLKRYWDILPTIIISFNNPFHLFEAPLVKTYINAYSSNKRTMEILGDMLIGELPFKGANPVDPFCSLEEAHL
jgi:beta-N-acetylhexosaminidase